MIDKIEAYLGEKGWTQSAFETLALLSANRISKWKNGVGEPTAKQALRMARLLGVPVEFLIDDELDQPALTPVSDREREVLEMVRTIGPDEAYRRILAAPGHRDGREAMGGRVSFPGGQGEVGRKGVG